LGVQSDRPRDEGRRPRGIKLAREMKDRSASPQRALRRARIKARCTTVTPSLRSGRSFRLKARGPIASQGRTPARCAFSAQPARAPGQFGQSAVSGRCPYHTPRAERAPAVNAVVCLWLRPVIFTDGPQLAFASSILRPRTNASTVLRLAHFQAKFPPPEGFN
jgi:hypothetical protein